jgi:hypothetical protein
MILISRCAPRHSTGSYIHRWDKCKDNKIGPKRWSTYWDSRTRAEVAGWSERKMGWVTGVRVSPHVRLPWKNFWNLLIHLLPQTFSIALRHQFHHRTSIPSHTWIWMPPCPSMFSPSRLNPLPFYLWHIPLPVTHLTPRKTPRPPKIIRPPQAHLDILQGLFSALGTHLDTLGSSYFNQIPPQLGWMWVRWAGGRDEPLSKRVSSENIF